MSLKEAGEFSNHSVQPAVAQQEDGKASGETQKKKDKGLPLILKMHLWGAW